MSVLDTKDTAAIDLSDSRVLVEERSEVGRKLLKILLILLLNLSESKAGSGLLVDEGTESGLSLNEAVRNIVLSAESRKVENELDGVDVVGDDNELGLSVLDEGGDVGKSELNNDGLLSGLLFTSLISGFLLESLDLGLSGLGLILGEKLEELVGLVSLESVRELSDLRGDLKSGHQDSLLSLHLDVVGPLDESSQIGLVHDVLTDSVVSGSLLEESRGGRFLLGRGGLNNLFTLV